MNSHKMKALVASYWRYVRQCPVVGLEVEDGGGELADVMAVDKKRYLVETEIKTSLADLKRDIKKKKHRRFREGRAVVRHFYFAVPSVLAAETKRICDGGFPYAGILSIVSGMDEHGIVAYKPPRALTEKRLAYREVLYLIRSQSATLCRLSKKVDELLRVQQDLMAQLKYYREGANG